MLQAPRIVRWTLPALLLTLVVGAFVIVAASGREDSATPKSTARTLTTSAKKGKKFERVTVRRGDTASSIAQRADLSEVGLLKLNPNVDPRSLRPGQRLRTSQ